MTPNNALNGRPNSGATLAVWAPVSASVISLQIMTSLQKSIHDWLQSQGYSLEMRVAKAFRETGFEVVQSEYYQDDETDTYREIDVIASIGTLIDKRVVDFLYVVECKYSKEKPWVLFTSSNRPSHSSALAVEGSLSSELAKIMLLEMSLLDEARENEIFSLPDRLGYGATRALASGKDQAFEAVTVVSKAALSTISRIETKWNVHGKTSRVCVVFPMIVLDGDPFEAFLTEQNEVVVEPLQRGTLVQRSPCFPNDHCIVDIVPERSLRGYLVEIESGWDSLTRIIETKLDRFPRIMAKEITSR